MAEKTVIVGEIKGQKAYDLFKGTQNKLVLGQVGRGKTYHIIEKNQK